MYISNFLKNNSWNAIQILNLYNKIEFFKIITEIYWKNTKNENIIFEGIFLNFYKIIQETTFKNIDYVINL